MATPRGIASFMDYEMMDGSGDDDPNPKLWRVTAQFDGEARHVFPPELVATFTNTDEARAFAGYLKELQTRAKR